MKKRKYSSYHRILASIVFSELITGIFSLIDGKFIPELFIYGFIVPLVVAPTMIYISNSIRRSTDEALKKSEEETRALLNAVPDLIVRINRDYTVLDYKTPVDFKPELPKGEFAGRNIEEIFPSAFSGKLKDLVEKTLLSGQMQETGFSIPVFGNLRHYEMRIVKSGESEAISIVRDITEQRTLEEQLRHAQKMEAIGTLTGGIAHEYNNIMTSIIGFGELLQDGLEENSTLRKHADMIVSSGERASRLTQSLLAYSRKQVTRIEAVDMNDIINKLESFLARIVREDIKLVIETSNESVIAMVDRAQIEHAIINLTANAIDAMPDGGVLGIRASSVKFERGFLENRIYMKPGEYAVIYVSDTGTGIDEKIRDKVFEPFFTTKDIGKGTGLGLSMVYGIIKKHGGYINFKSETGTGTTFKLYIPSSRQKELATKPETPEVSSKTEPATILVAEDDEGVRSFVRETLKRAGHSVIEAADGDDAIKTFFGWKDEIKLLLFDAIMPRTKGIEAYEEIKKINPGINVIFMSGYLPDSPEVKSLIDKGHEFIQKPINPDELILAINRMFAKTTP